MIQLFSRSLCIVVLGILAQACSDSPSAPTPTPSAISSASEYVAAQLDGTWTVTSIHPANQSPQQKPADAAYSITFSAGRLSTRTDCNVCGGAFSVSGDTLTAGPNLACTRALCPTAAFEHAYTTLLSGDSVVATSNNTLTLSSSRGAIQFVR